MITSGAIGSLKIAIVYWLSVASPTCLKLQNGLKEWQKGTNKDPVISSVSLWRCQERICSQKNGEGDNQYLQGYKVLLPDHSCACLHSPAISCSLPAPVGNFEMMPFATRFNQLMFLGSLGEIAWGTVLKQAKLLAISLLNILAKAPSRLWKEPFQRAEAVLHKIAAKSNESSSGGISLSPPQLERDSRQEN